MRVLLLNPPSENTPIEYPDEDGNPYLEVTDFGLFPPLGLLYILGYLEAHAPGNELFLIDCIAEGISQAELPHMVAEIRPHVVGVTSFTVSLVDVCLAARTVREVAPEAHLCLGGHHPIAFPFEAAQLKEFDSIVVGEGEIAFTELVKALGEGRDITDIPGVYTETSIQRWRTGVYRDRRLLGGIPVPPSWTEDLDALPFPARHYSRHINYHSAVGVTNRLTTMISSRGCRHRCTFCDVPFRRLRQRAPAKVADEVEACLEDGYKEVHFYDDSFNVTPERVVKFADELKRRHIQFPWDFRGRVDAITKEALARAQGTGLRMVTFGVETGSDEGLREIKKGITVRQVREAFRGCRELGIQTVADFMIGFPFERTREDVLRNLDFLFDLDPDYVQIGILTLYPHTALFDEAAQRRLIDPQRWVDFAQNPRSGFELDLWDEHLSAAELVRLQRHAYRRFYLRPRYIVRRLLGLTSWYEFRAKIAGMLKLLGG